MYIKYCPKCGKEQKYKTIVTYERALKTNCLCRSCVKGQTTENNIKRLLSNELESFYWIGFLMADGHFSQNKRIKITLSEKDSEHLQKFREYVDIKNIIKSKIKKYDLVTVSAQDIHFVPKITKKFDIKHNKTFSPPSVKVLKNFSKSQILSLIIGFIDGDGCIKNVYKRKDWSIDVKSHNTWKEVLEFFQKQINGKNNVKINKSGYAKMHITDVPSTIKLKKFALKNNLPILERKWNIVDLDYVTFYQIAGKRLQKIKRLAKENKTISDIAKEIGISYGGVYRYIRKYNIKIRINGKKSRKKESANDQTYAESMVHG